MSNYDDDKEKEKKEVKKIYECKVLRDMNSDSDQQVEDINKGKKKNYLVFYLVLSTVALLLVLVPNIPRISNLLKKEDSLGVNSSVVSPPLLKVNPSSSSEILSPEQIYEKCSKSVVGIVISQDSSYSGFGSFSDFYGPSSRLGSGIVISKDGYILTNAHVVGDIGKNSQISVSFKDSEIKDGVEAKLIGMDVVTDLAVIKVDVDRSDLKLDLNPAVFGDSDSVKPGQSVCAIGYPLGIGKAITQGIVSGLDRSISDDIWGLKCIQTDASINPGNSGGALFNNRGEVIGINSMKVAAGNAEGMGFAIPSKDAVQIVNDLREKGYVSRPALGVTVTETRYGLSIVEINNRSELKKFANKNDIILEINGRRVQTLNELRSEIKKCKIGDRVMIKIENWATKQVTDVPVTLFDIGRK